MEEKYIMSFDQGTTSSRCIIFDKEGNIVSKNQTEIKQIYPKDGFVEQDPMEIWGSQIGVATTAMRQALISPEEIKAIGITNQRETTVVWDKETGIPIYNAIVWQCRRTADYCKELTKAGYHKTIKEKTGLVLDPYFSATKIKWILDNVPYAKERAKEGKLLFGNIDTWLIWNLTKGKCFITDYTNASRTMVFNIFEKKWDKELLELFDIPESMLPKVVSSSGVIGLSEKGILGREIPIAGIAGDQQSALFGQKCFKKGMAKNTYGTGCFLLMNTGKEPVISNKGLITTIGVAIGDEIQYALEGSVFIGGAVIQWLRDEMGLIKDAAETLQYARAVPDSNGVYFVPAFTGLGAPYWDPYAKGLITGIKRDTRREHIIRASLESMAYQSMDIINLMIEESGIDISVIKVDGGASANDFLMEFQADILNKTLIRPANVESTALGAALLAGIATRFYKLNDKEDLSSGDSVFKADMEESQRILLKEGWKKAVDMCREKR